MTDDNETAKDADRGNLPHRERLAKVDRYEADLLQAYLDGLTDPEEIRHMALSALLGSLFDKLRSIVEEMRVIEKALNRIGEWDEDEEVSA